MRKAENLVYNGRAFSDAARAGVSMFFKRFKCIHCRCMYTYMLTSKFRLKSTLHLVMHRLKVRSELGLMLVLYDPNGPLFAVSWS
jgi:hypothetical protein